MANIYGITIIRPSLQCGITGPSEQELLEIERYKAETKRQTKRQTGLIQRFWNWMIEHG